VTHVNRLQSDLRESFTHDETSTLVNIEGNPCDKTYRSLVSRTEDAKRRSSFSALYLIGTSLYRCRKSDPREKAERVGWRLSL
jgi:hypothetical protein